MFLSDDVVALRPLRLEDADGPYLRWINDQAGDIYTEHAQFPHSREGLEDYIRSKHDSDGDILLAVTLAGNDEHVGNISISSIDWVHGTGVYSILVAPVAQGKGVGWHASWLLLNHCFEKLNLHRIELGVHADNNAAISLYRKLGFVEEGRKREVLSRGGARFDVLVMGMLRGELAG